MEIFFVWFFVYSRHLLISSASVRSIPFLSFIVPIFAWNVPLISLTFLKRCLVFPSYCFPLSLCIDHQGRLSYLSLLFFGTLHSNGYTFLLFFAFCFSSLPFASLLLSAICKASLDNHFAFLHFFSWEWFWSLPPVQSYKPLSIVLQAVYEICLEPIFHFHCIIIRDLI